jgi:hypothetical protein
LMTFWVVEPEVAGSIGPRTVMRQSSVGGWFVEKLNYEFQGWLGDQLLETTPCFIVTAKVAESMTSSDLTGFSFDDVECTTSDLFKELHPERALPAFRWLKIDADAGQADIGLTPDLMLVVSAKALGCLDGAINNAVVEPWQP